MYVVFCYLFCRDFCETYTLLLIGRSHAGSNKMEYFLLQSQCSFKLGNTTLILRGRPLMIWGWGWRKSREKKFGGASPGKNKFQKAFRRPEHFARPTSGTQVCLHHEKKINSKAIPAEKINSFSIFPPPLIINGRPLNTGCCCYSCIKYDVCKLISRTSIYGHVW